MKNDPEFLPLKNKMPVKKRKILSRSRSFTEEIGMKCELLARLGERGKRGSLR